MTKELIHVLGLKAPIWKRRVECREKEGPRGFREGTVGDGSIREGR